MVSRFQLQNGSALRLKPDTILTGFDCDYESRSPQSAKNKELSIYQTLQASLSMFTFVMKRGVPNGFTRQGVA